MTDHCEKCGKARADGYIMIDGQCVECAPDRFIDRKRLLQIQAKMLLEESR